MDSVFLRENRGHLSENLSTKNYSFGAKMRIIRRLPPNGSHPLRIPRNTRAQVKLAKSLAWPKEWGPCCVAFGRAFGSHPKGSGVRSSSGPPKMEIAAVKTAAISRLTTEIPQTDFCGRVKNFSHFSLQFADSVVNEVSQQWRHPQR